MKKQPKATSAAKQRLAKASLAQPILMRGGAVIWNKPDGTEKVLLDQAAGIYPYADSLCGIGIFNTGADDPLKFACDVHDLLYQNRHYFQSQGWDREKMDKFFFDIMIVLAGEDEELLKRAQTYYNLVHSFGWIFFYT